MNEQDILSGAIEALAGELQIEVQFEASALTDSADTDGFAYLDAPINQKLPIEIKRWHNKPASLIASAMKQQGEGVVLVTDHIAEPKAKALREHGVEFFDVAGNAYLNRSGLYVWIAGKKFPSWDGPGIVDARAAFERTGLKVTFALLTQPGLENQPYRTIADASGVALGTVKRVIDSLETSGYLLGTGRNRVLRTKPDLINDWTQAYINKLLPKIELGTFETGVFITPETIINYQGSVCWGGEVAADRLTGYLKPNNRTLYIDESQQNQFMKQFKVRRSSPFNMDTAGGTVQLRRQFWPKTFTYSNDASNAHPLVVYADLIATNDARNTETAELIYEQYLKPLCR